MTLNGATSPPTRVGCGIAGGLMAAACLRVTLLLAGSDRRSALTPHPLRRR
jgi:hypothetical protein